MSIYRRGRRKAYYNSHLLDRARNCRPLNRRSRSAPSKCVQATMDMFVAESSLGTDAHIVSNWGNAASTETWGRTSGWLDGKARAASGTKPKGLRCTDDVYVSRRGGCCSAAAPKQRNTTREDWHDQRHEQGRSVNRWGA